MTAFEFYGCALIAFAPPMSMFCLTLANNPIFIIVMLSSGFFWLLSLMLSSIIWAAVTFLKDYLLFGVICSVILQEISRYLFYSILKRAQIGLQRVSDVGNRGSLYSISWLSLSYASGFGFGIMSGLFSIVNILADAAGPGTVGLYGDSPNFFIVSAFSTLAIILLHTFWGIIFFEALDRKCNFKLCYVVLSHIAVSGLTFFNQQQLYLASLIPCYFLTLITAAIAFQSAGGTFKSLKESFSFSSS